MKVDLWVGQLVGSAFGICGWLQELLAVKVGNIMKHMKHAPVRGSHDMIIIYVYMYNYMCVCYIYNYIYNINNIRIHIRVYV